MKIQRKLGITELKKGFRKECVAKGAAERVKLLPADETRTV